MNQNKIKVFFTVSSFNVFALKKQKKQETHARQKVIRKAYLCFQLSEPKVEFTIYEDACILILEIEEF